VELSGTALAPSVDCGSSFGTHLLEVRGLEVGILDSTPQLPVLQGINFHIASGEIIGLLGESGAGKTTLALTLLRLLSSPFRVARGSIEFESRPLLSLNEGELRKTRGAKISIICQDSTVLNPVMRVGDQMVEVLRAHRDWSKQRCREDVWSLLEELEFEEVDRVYTSYPHQLSGGQRQRIVIGQALVCRPALVIADEPTASLDPATTNSILELVRRVNRQFNIAFLVISHDIEILTQLADRVMVMYAGRIVEQGPCREIMQEPLHPYTRALLSCALTDASANHARTAKSSLLTIAGSGAAHSRTSLHCDFEGCCADRMRICATEVPREVEAGNAHTVSCFKYGNA
jgi:peptide/nickel transport system ATP-binding protein